MLIWQISVQLLMLKRQTCCREDLKEEQNGVACILRTKSQYSPVSEVEINEMLETLLMIPSKI